MSFYGECSHQSAVQNIIVISFGISLLFYWTQHKGQDQDNNANQFNTDQIYWLQTAL